jgi:hypothetical protein
VVASLVNDIPEAPIKDWYELPAAREVCSGRIELRRAQHDILATCARPNNRRVGAPTQ